MYFNAILRQHRDFFLKCHIKQYSLMLKLKNIKLEAGKSIGFYINQNPTK